MIENIECSEENAYSVAGHNFDKENFVESNDSGLSDYSDYSDYSYAIPVIVVFVIAGLVVSDHLEHRREENYISSTTLLRELREIRQHSVDFRELLNNEHYTELYLPPRSEYFYLRTEQMKLDLQSLGLITTDDLPECITRGARIEGERPWDACYDPSDGRISMIRHISYDPSESRVSEKFELHITNSDSGSEGSNEFNLTDVYTHFCYVYAATYNRYVIREYDAYRHEDVKHLQNIFDNIKTVESILEGQDNKEGKIIVTIELVQELDTKLLEFIKRVLMSRYMINLDPFDIEFFDREKNEIGC